MAISDKLTYLNTTKSLIRDGINAIGGELTSNDTFRSYVNALNNIYDYLPKVTGTGTSITLNDTAKGKMILELDPSELTQDGTPTPSSPQDIHTISGSNKVIVCGKNLFDGEWEVGYININTGVDVASANVRTKNFIRIQPNTQYAISNTTSHDTWAVYYTQNKAYISNQKIKTGLSETFTTPNDSNIYYIRWYDAGSTGDTPKWQLEKGSTATTYEPYVSQEADIDLGDIEYCKIGNYEDKFIRNSGKNLFDGEIELGSINIDTGENASSTTRTRSKNYIKVKPNTTYYISFGGTTGYRWVVGYKANKTIITDGTINQEHPSALYQSANNGTFTTTATTEYIRWYDTGNTNINDLVMIAQSSVAVDYEPYGSNEWYIKKSIPEYVLDGTQTISYNGSATTPTDRTTFRFTLPYFSLTTDYISNRFVQGSSTSNRIVMVANSDRPYISFDDAILGITTSDTNAQKEEKCKTWLASNNVIIKYISAAPTYTPITGTLAEQLEYVYQNMLSQTGQTNISQVNNDLPFIINASALQDLSTL